MSDTNRLLAYERFVGKQERSVVSKRHLLNALAAVAKKNKRKSMALLSNYTPDGSNGMYWGGVGLQQVTEINRSARKR